MGFESTITCIRATCPFQIWRTRILYYFQLRFHFPWEKFLRLKHWNVILSQILNVVKLTDNIYPCNNLTHFEYEVRSMTGNGNYVNLLKTVWKTKLVKWLIDLKICRSVCPAPPPDAFPPASSGSSNSPPLSKVSSKPFPESTLISFAWTNTSSRRTKTPSSVVNSKLSGNSLPLSPQEM